MIEKRKIANANRWVTKTELKINALITKFEQFDNIQNIEPQNVFLYTVVYKLVIEQKKFLNSLSMVLFYLYSQDHYTKQSKRRIRRIIRKAVPNIENTLQIGDLVFESSPKELNDALKQYYDNYLIESIKFKKYSQNLYYFMLKV